MAEDNVRRFSDWAASRTPVLAHQVGFATRVGSEYWDQFVTTGEAEKIEAALTKARINYTFSIDPSLEREPEEKRIPFLYTFGGMTWDAGQILATIWQNAIDEPGALQLRADDNSPATLFWVPDPKPAPLQRPNAGLTSGDDLRNTGGVIGDSGAFTAADRRTLNDIKALLALLVAR